MCLVLGATFAANLTAIFAIQESIVLALTALRSLSVKFPRIFLLEHTIILNQLPFLNILQSSNTEKLMNT